MGQAKPPIQPKDRRISNFSEVVLGVGKKQNVDEARRCPQCAVATCLPSCPLGIDIPGFIRLLREDDATGALERILVANPFPAICGRICTAPCESSCVFHDEGTEISIRQLERYASDNGKPKAPIKKPSTIGHKKVAIVGSGPAGMSAAFYLAQSGLGVTIFEAQDQVGGLLRYGIPEFRLPSRIIDEQFSQLRAMGVKIVTNAMIGSTMKFSDVFSQNYAALLLTTGAANPNFINIKGHDLGGVYYATEILMRAQLLSKTGKIQDDHLWRGQETVIIGQGQSALDAARFSLRMGQKVNLIFDGLEEQIGLADELQLAIEEGLTVVAPAKLISIDADPQGFAKSIMIEPLSVVEEEDVLLVKEAGLPHKSINAQTVILANGTVPSHFLSTHLPQLKMDEDGTVCVDENGLTSMEKIFAAGNVVTGAGSVVDAIASGKDIAAKIVKFLDQ